MTDEEFLEQAKQDIATLESIEHMPYSEGPIPSPDDERIAAIVDLYIASSPIQRELLRTAQTDKALAKRAYELLCAFSVRMAMLSVRRGSEPILTRALIALVMNMDWYDSDARDCGYFTGPLLAYCAFRIGADRERLYDLAQEIAVDKWTKGIAGRPREDQNPDKLLEMIAYRAIETPSGVVFQHSNRPIPPGHLVSETTNPNNHSL